MNLTEAKPSYQQMCTLPPAAAALGTLIDHGNTEGDIDHLRPHFYGGVDLWRKGESLSESVPLKSSVGVGRCERAAFVYSVKAQSIKNLKITQTII